MATRDYDSYIFRKGVSPNTLSVISSKNRIYAVNAVGQFKQIGVIATFDPSEARTIEPIRGIGFGDHIAELVPGVTDPMTISVTRSALYVSNIFQVFGYKSGIDGLVRSLRHHRWPFDIRQEVVFSRLAFENTGVKENLGDVDLDIDEQAGLEGNPSGTLQALITVYEACWISDYSVSYASDTALVQETVTINVSDILSQEPFSSYTDAYDYDQLATDEQGISQRLR
jgi:hypothetical protein